MIHFCRFLSFLLCCRRPETRVMSTEHAAHAGNRLMVCEHCAANVLLRCEDATRPR